MWLRSILESFNPRGSRAEPGRQGSDTVRRRAACAQLQLEAFEDRSLPSTYVITHLGTLGGDYSWADDVNTSGQVAGTSATAGGWHNAFLWTGGVLIDLGTLGGAWSSASSLNDRGQVVGTSATPDGVGHAFLLTPEDTNGDGSPDRWFRDGDGDGANDLMTALQQPPGATRSEALDINNAGAVTGVAGDAAGNSQAFLWTVAGVTNLGTLGGTEAVPTGINDAGQVVGRAQDSAGRFRAFLWDGAHGMTDLSPPDSSEAGAYGISPSGLVAGATGTTGFLWTPDQPNGVTGTMTALAPPGGVADAIPESSAASDVNDAGVVIGSSTYYVLPDPWSPYYPNGGYYTSRPSVWKNGVGEDLGVLGVTAANGINAAGQIAGAQYYEGESGDSAVLLTPAPPTLSITDVWRAEGNSGTTLFTFTVRLGSATDKTVTVAYATADGTAKDGIDYLAASGTLTIPAGQTSETITVQVIGDRTAEPSKTFFVNLSNPTNATIADGQGLGTIVDDEPRISINNVSKQEGKKNQTTLFTFTVTLSAAYDQPVTMSFRTLDGTATTSDGDYNSKSGTLTFAPGETTKTITVEVKGDSKKEADEYFYLDLFGNSSNSLFTKSRGVGTIVNDD